MRHFLKLTSVLCSISLIFSLMFSVPLSCSAASSSFTMHIEGKNSTIFAGTLFFASGSSLYNIVADALKTKGIAFDMPSGKYGHYINSINRETQADDYSSYWHIYNNGVAAESGIDGVKPANGDFVVIYLGDDSKLLYPTITFSPKYPLSGQQITATVSAYYYDYTSNSMLNKPVSGVSLKFGAGSYITGNDGTAVFTAPAAGSYALSANKATPDSTPATVRIYGVSVKVYAEGTAPSGGIPVITPVPVLTGKTDIKAALSSVSPSVSYIKNAGVTDWCSSLTLNRANIVIPKNYLSAQAAEINDGITNATSLSGVIIGLRAAGADPQNFNGQNLIKRLCSMKIGNTGLNGYTYSLLALDCGGYNIPTGSKITRDGLVSGILSYQRADGSFSLSKSSASDSDMTAIAITALAPYTAQPTIQAAIDRAVTALSKMQKSDGGYLAFMSSDEASESVAQVIIALSSIGIDVTTDSRFSKNSSLLDNLMSFKRSDGSFAHQKSGDSDLISTQQAALALEAISLYKSSGTRLYDLTSTKVAAANVQVANPESGTGNPSSIMPSAIAVFVSSALLLTALLLRKKVSHN